MLPSSGHGFGQDRYDEVVRFGSGRPPGGRWLPRIAPAAMVLSRWLFVAAAGGKLVTVDASTDRAERPQAPLPAIAQVAVTQVAIRT